ncbi:MAG: hypothetical protein C4345_11295 [Chloroflexota bacterium]
MREENTMAYEIKLLDLIDIELEASFLVLGRAMGQTVRVKTWGCLILGGADPILVDTGAMNAEIMQRLGMTGIISEEMLIENQLVDVIQPDVCHCGGIKELLKIAAMAETYNIVVAPHNPNGPVATAASVHAAACMPNFLILEYALSPTRDECQAGEVFKAVNGRIELPTRPGLGIELDEAYLASHPWQGVKLWRGLHYADGSVADV